MGKSTEVYSQIGVIDSIQANKLKQSTKNASDLRNTSEKNP